MLSPMPRQVCRVRSQIHASQNVQRSTTIATQRETTRRGLLQKILLGLYEDPEVISNAPESEVKKRMRSGREGEPVVTIVVPT